MNKTTKKQVLLGFISFCIFFLSAAYITYPLLFHLNNLVTGMGDELYIAWAQNWVIHSLLTNPFSLFEANLYFPYHTTLAYSETFITSSILAMPIKLFFHESIATVNFTLISSLVFLGFSIYVLCYYLTKDYWASLLAGILTIFSPAVLDKKVHLQMLAIEWVPLAILFFLYFIKSKKTKFLCLSLFFFLIQMYNSFLPGYFIIFSYIIIFIFYFLYERKKALALITKKRIFLCLTTILLILPIIIPYLQVSKEFHYERDIRDAIHFALQPEDFLYSTTDTRLGNFLISLPINLHAQNGEFKPGYLGLIFSILGILVLYYYIKQFDKKNFIANSFLSIALLGFVLSLGPVLHLGRQTIHQPFPIPLPYILFYYIIPGFNGFRNSARWEMLFLLLLVVLIALALSTIFKKISRGRKIIIYSILIIGTIAEFNFPMRFYPLPQRKDFPQVYSWLNTTPKGSSVIIMPAYNWNMPYAAEEIKREYLSTENFRRMVNGYSGFSPPPWQDLLVNLHKNFPDEKTLKTLKSLGVTYIIIDKEMYDKGFKEKNEKVSGETVVSLLKIDNRVTFVKQIGDYYVFML